MILPEVIYRLPSTEVWIMMQSSRTMLTSKRLLKHYDSKYGVLFRLQPWIFDHFGIIAPPPYYKERSNTWRGRNEVKTAATGIHINYYSVLPNIYCETHSRRLRLDHELFDRDIFATLQFVPWLPEPFL